jgi:hypothetical protein
MRDFKEGIKVNTGSSTVHSTVLTLTSKTWEPKKYWLDSQFFSSIQTTRIPRNILQVLGQLKRGQKPYKFIYFIRFLK